MSLGRLILRSLAHYHRTAAVVVMGLAIATAVIVGSLVIGDSIEGSIRHTSLARLGAIHDAVTAPRFFSANLLETSNLSGTSSSLIRMDGSARREMGEAVFANIAVLGAEASFFRLYPDTKLHSLEPRAALINQTLASAADVHEGDTLLVTVSRPGQAMADTLFARRERHETLATLRVSVQAVLPDLGPGGFHLDASTAMPHNVIVDREWLAGQIGEEGGANTIVVSGADDLRLREQIDQRMTLDDFGLYLREHDRWLSVFSDASVLSETQVKGARSAAESLGEVSPVSVYLADTITSADDPSREIAYALVADLPARDLPLRSLQSVPEDGLILNAWAAEDLGAEVGERFTLRWRVSTPSGYEDHFVNLTLVDIAELEGLAADPGLVPDFEGITDAEHINDWDPPFPVDLSLVTDRDDAYWERYRAAPKAFVSSELLKRMWRGEAREGPWVTSMRVETPAGDDLAAEYERALLKELSPEEAGMRFIPLRGQAIAASKGTSDFGQLFLGMSFFLVLAGAGLAGTLMRLSAERRASQAGIMRAIGFTATQSGRVITAEGVTLSLVGVVIGTPLGIGYAHAIINMLAAQWQGALGDAPVLGVYLEPLSIAIGAIAALIVGVLATWWGARVLSGKPVLELLRGWQASGVAQDEGRPWTAIAAPVLMVLAAGIFAAAITEAIPTEGAFFGIGGTLLLAALTGAHLLLNRAMAHAGATRSGGAFALRAAASARGRSLLLLGLIAAATFVIVTVAANSRDFSEIDVHDRTSGTGGFSLIATSSIPLRFDPATERGRENLGFLLHEQEALQDVEIISLMRSPGEDISCLNVARPALPRLLGATDALIERGGFTFASAIADAAGNPWALLREKFDGEAARAITDSASLQWQLHSAVGDEYDAGANRPLLHFVGALSGSIFQSEIVIHAAVLRQIYPDIAGPSYFLIDVPRGREEQVADALRSALGDMGVDVRSTREVLNRFITVQNTYLSMFLALGGLGLLLGTIGLVAVILRSAFERRAEFALMLATGFTPANLAWLVLVENAGLLIAGMLIGTSTALISVAPHLTSAQANVNWVSLAGVLSAVLVVGLAACAVGARATIRGNLIEALRTE